MIYMNKTVFIFGLTYLIFSIPLKLQAQCKTTGYIDHSPGYEIAAFYFPDYHNNDLRNEERYGKGWSEWELVRNAVPRFEGQKQPKIPDWGYTNESDPEIMEMKINTAAEYGVDVFIYDWYYYNDGPFLDETRAKLDSILLDNAKLIIQEMKM